MARRIWWYCPAAPILNLKESLENPFLKDRKNIQKLKTKRGLTLVY